MNPDATDTTPTTLPGEDVAHTAPAPGRGWARYAELAVTLAVIALGIVILIDTRDIRVPKAFSSVGPRVVPTIVGWGLVIVGIWYAIDVILGHTAAPSGDSEDADPTLPADWGVLGGLAITLIAYAALIRPVGFVLASTVLFAGAAVAMGSRQVLRDLAIGLVLSAVTYYAFTEWLGIRLPEGILEGLPW
jgi:putative tricarboxylic transport membrane protein